MCDMSLFTVNWTKIGVTWARHVCDMLRHVRKYLPKFYLLLMWTREQVYTVSDQNKCHFNLKNTFQNISMSQNFQTIRDINCGEIAFSYFKSDTSTLLDPPFPQNQCWTWKCVRETLILGGRGLFTENYSNNSFCHNIMSLIVWKLKKLNKEEAPTKLHVSIVKTIRESSHTTQSRSYHQNRAYHYQI